LSYRPARLHKLPESIPGLLKRLQIRAPAGISRKTHRPRYTDRETVEDI
jgi:hypothetical protein